MILNLLAILFCVAASVRSVSHYPHNNPDKALDEADCG